MIDREQVQQWFPNDDLLVVPASALDGRVSDEGARTMLCEVGVPESFLEVMEFDSGLGAGISTVDESYRADDEGYPGTPGGAGELLYLGYAGQALFALDGTSGEVRQVRSEHGARPFAPSLEAFVRALGAVSEELRKNKRKPTLDGLLQIVAPELGGQAGSAEPAWRMLLSDVVAYSAG